MKKFQLYITAAAILVLAACGESKKEGDAVLIEKKEKLAKLTEEQQKLSEEIAELQDAISAAEPNVVQAKLVQVDTVTAADFMHYIELQGKVDADNISIVTPRGNPGQVKQIFVTKGQMVKKGQLLLKLDDAIYQQNIIASKQSIQTLKTQQSLATELLKRQQNLWNQGIGTEVQLLTAKNNVETLQTQIKSAEEQIKVLQEQQSTTNVYAEVSGIADEVNVRVGEFFQGAIGAQPQIRIVNTSSLKVVTNVPENYASRVGRGSKAVISIPDVKQTFNSTISFLSASIDPSNRSFVTEASLPSNPSLKPNMIAMVRILDYNAPSAITVPVNVVQSDEKGKYVFVMVKEGTKYVARKKQVVVGQVQDDLLELKAGISSGELLITAGYQGLYDGQLITPSDLL
jgi:membrane fusion protein, multidrug efflux system